MCSSLWVKQWNLCFIAKPGDYDEVINHSPTTTKLQEKIKEKYIHHWQIQVGYNQIFHVGF